MSTPSARCLADLDGRVRRLAGMAEPAGLLLVFVERDCPTSTATLAALARAGGRIAVVSQGRPEAAADLVARTGAEHLDVLVDPAPHAASAAFDLTTVPTLIRLDTDGTEVDRCVGWDRSHVVAMLAAVGGQLTGSAGLPELKPGCSARNALPLDLQQQAARDDAELAADGDVEEMWRRGWTDGLPVVPPTRRRVDAMLAGRDPAAVLGTVPPTLATLTVERLAACAVLAGCAPEHFPVVLAATAAVLDPVFNLHGIQNTTHFASPVLVVNGPVRATAGMNAGAGAFGPGNRANATIGRTVRLMMSLTGGATPGLLDMSTLGGPHKFGLAFAENQEASPWEPLHVELGFDADASAVTAIAGESPAGLSDHYSATPEALATTLALSLGNVWSPLYYPVGAAQTLLVVCPEHAALFAEAGWSKQRLREELCTRSRRPAGQLRAAGSGELAPETLAASEDDLIGKFTDPAEIVIVVAGGPAGRFSAVVPPVGLGSAMVTRPIPLD